MNTCKWPGCDVKVEHNKVCGHHQMALRVVYKTILGLGFSKEVAKIWACKLGPYVAVQKNGDPWQMEPMISTTVAKKCFRAVGLGQRTAYERLAGIDKLEPAKLDTNRFMVRVILDGEWVSVSETARELATSHRYLRHLVYETRVPELVALSHYRNSGNKTLGFYRTELPSLQRLFQQVNRRRTQ